jgi:hypothetical protein
MNTADGWLTRDISEVGGSIRSCVVSVTYGHGTLPLKLMT